MSVYVPGTQEKDLSKVIMSLQQLAQTGGASRPTLTADKTYYVRSDGSDTNDGSADLPSNAFLTVARALSVVSGIDSGSFQLTVQIDAGTWTVPIALPRMVGALIPILTGVGSTTIINISGSVNTCIANDGGTPWQVNNMKITGGVYCLHAVNGGVIRHSGIEFGATNAFHTFAEDTSAVRATGNYTISGGASFHAGAANGYNALGGGITITLTGTPAFTSAFVLAASAGYIWAQNATFSGSATGSRYSAILNGVVYTAGGGATYFPGNAVGTTDGFGVYG